MPALPNQAPESPPERWRRAVALYRGGDAGRSILQVTTTASFFAALWIAMLWSLSVSYAITLLLSVPTACLLVRLFMIQHDCGHGSYFRSRWARDWIGFCIGVLTLIPYRYWRRMHANHHVHHLSSLIPNYKLEPCFRANPDLQRATRITLVNTWRLLRLTLWDEEARRLVRFRDLKQPRVGIA